MNTILKFTANVIRKVAEMGAGQVSSGILFEPDVPMELSKDKKDNQIEEREEY